MNSNLIVHVGTAKTGTTSLHYALYKLSPWLLSEGVNYPNLNGSGFGWTAERGRSAGNADPTYPGVQWKEGTWLERFKWMLDQSLKVSTPNESIVLSSELLSALCTEEDFWGILRKFQVETGRRVCVVMYLRDPFSMFVTCFQQNVKNDGFFGEAEDFIKVFTEDGRVSRFYLHMNLQKVIGFAHGSGIDLSTFRYEDSLPEVENHFFENVLNLAIPRGIYSPKKFNSSLSFTEVDFHRGVNSIDPNLGQLFGYERTDSHLARNIKRYQSRYGLFLQEEGVEKLNSIFREYQKIVSECVDFSTRIDFSVNEAIVQSNLTPEIEQIRLEIFELGRFVALSYKNGYLDWVRRRSDV